MFKKSIVLLLLFLYLYTLTFNIFLTSVIRIPAPILFGLPLLFLGNSKADGLYLYKKEMFFFVLASALLFLFAQQVVKIFFVVIIITAVVSLYFSYVVGDDLRRLKLSVWIFYGLLGLSSVVMLLNRVYPAEIILLRSLLTGELIKQSPSGITPYIFSFGFQLSALVSFLVIASIAFRTHVLVKMLAFGTAVILILYGMNRSVAVVFGISVGLFWLLYYRMRTVFLVSALVGLSLIFKSEIADLSSSRGENILAKNSMNSDEHRSYLMLENLKIIADNPFGIAFSGKTWNEVAGLNPVFRMGDEGLITSHNCYLMFVTYLGILVGGILLWVFYRKIGAVFWDALHHVRDREYALLVTLCFSFFAISLNSLFHNEWLLGSGPTLFLYFSILHLSKLMQTAKNS